MQNEKTTKVEVYLEKCVIYFLILAYFLPISLFVTIEFCRALEQFQFDLDKNNWSRQLKAYLKEHGPFKIKESPFADLSIVQRSATLKNSVVLEDMAELDYIFTDKTGTLTKNEMRLVYAQGKADRINF